MKLKNRILSNVTIQAIGPILSFSSIFLIARIFGPVTQGKFASFKSFVDLIVVIGLFGFPQSFVYLMNKLKVSPNKLAKTSLLYCCCFCIITFSFLFAASNLGLLDSISSLYSTTQLLILSLICGSLVLHGLWRGVYLGYNEGRLFALFSILPATVLFSVIVFASFIHNFSTFHIYLISSIPLLVVIFLLMRPIFLMKCENEREKLPWNQLFTHGTHSFLQALFLSLQPIIAYYFIRHYVGGEREIGFFNVGLFLVQGFGVPISMIAPLLFSKWTKDDNNLIVGQLNKFSKIILFADLIIGAILYCTISFIIDVFFTDQYGLAKESSQILLFSVPFMLHRNIIIPAIHAAGLPQYNTMLSLFRLISFCMCILIIGRYYDLSLKTISIYWTFTEIITLLFTLYILNRISRRKIPC